MSTSGVEISKNHVEHLRGEPRVALRDLDVRAQLALPVHQVAILPCQNRKTRTTATDETSFLSRRNALGKGPASNRSCRRTIGLESRSSMSQRICNHGLAQAAGRGQGGLETAVLERLLALEVCGFEHRPKRRIMDEVEASRRRTSRARVARTLVDG